MDNIETFLRENNISPTKQRLELAEIIFSKNQHFTAADLINMAINSDLNISQATVYNTLCLFEKRGILKTINLQNDCKFYDTNLSLHHHIYNTSSNLLTDVDNCEIIFSKLPNISKDLELEQTEVLIKVRNKS
tara:strand:- start:1505 stop:1903 length:399 start_codon:yes stop_codon:yes gene_type:complete